VNKSDMAKDSTDTITWDKLGIDMLVVDELHMYKNLFFHSKMTRIAGLPNADSQRAFDMFVKVRNLLQKQGHFIGLTGTPISNTMAEAFTLLRYFAYDMLEDMGLSHFDSWAQMFADAVMMPEMTPDGAGFRVNTRLARFTNIPELAGMLSQFMIMRRFKEVSEHTSITWLNGQRKSEAGRSIPGTTTCSKSSRKDGRRRWTCVYCSPVHPIWQHQRSTHRHGSLRKYTNAPLPSSRRSWCSVTWVRPSRTRTV